MARSKRLLLDSRKFVELYFMPSAILWAFCRMNCRFEFQKRSQFFIRTHNQTLSVVTMCVCNPDSSPIRNQRLRGNQLQPALLRLSAIISQYFILCRTWLLFVEQHG